MNDIDTVQLGGIGIYELERGELPPRSWERFYRRRLRKRYRKSYPLGGVDRIPRVGHPERARIDEMDCDEAVFRLGSIGAPFGARDVSDWVCERRQLFYRLPRAQRASLRPSPDAVAGAVRERHSYETLLRTWDDTGRIGDPPPETAPPDFVLKHPCYAKTFERSESQHALADLLNKMKQERESAPSTIRALKHPAVLAPSLLGLGTIFAAGYTELPSLVSRAAWVLWVAALLVIMHGLPIKRPRISPRGLVVGLVTVLPLAAFSAVVLWH